MLINKIIVHLPNYTVYVPWIVQEALDLKKKKHTNTNIGIIIPIQMPSKEKKHDCKFWKWSNWFPNLFI